MTVNPVELIGGLVGSGNVPKADVVSWAKARVPQVFGNADEVRSTTLAGQLVITIKLTGGFWYQDTSDMTTADNGVTCIVSADGRRFKPTSIIAPTTVSLGGVFASPAVADQFVTGLDNAGNLLRSAIERLKIAGTAGNGFIELPGQSSAASPPAAGGLRLFTDASERLAIKNAAGFYAGVSIASLTATRFFTLPDAAGTFVLNDNAATLTNKTIAAGSNTISGLTTSMFAANVVDTDGTMAANSSTRIPAQSAVVSYVAARIAALDVMLYKGVIDCSVNPNYPAADAGNTYRVSIAGKIGGGSGPNVEVGDILICITDGTSAGTHASVGANWDIVQVNIDGAVVGPASATSGNLASYNGTSGKTIQDSGIASSAVVTLTGSQSLSNKSLPSPIFTGTVDNQGGQIKFPATQSASADANTLDDYEEGTFTPTLTFGGGSTGITYSTQAGQYTKVGNCVHVRIQIVLTNKGSSTGAAVIGGLPFAVNGSVPGLLRLNNGAAAATTQTTSIAVTGTSSFNLEKFAAGAVTTMVDTDLTNTSTLLISAHYFV